MVFVLYGIKEAIGGGQEADFLIKIGPLFIVSSLANISILLLGLGWSGFGIDVEAWTTLIIGAATILGLLAAKLKGDIFYVLVICRALLGVIIKRLSASPPPITSRALAAGAGPAIILLIAIYKIFLKGDNGS